MSLVANWKFDQTDVTIEDSGNSDTLNNFGVVSTTDATYGNVASFNNGYFTLSSTPSALQGNSSRTMSVWYKLSSSPSSFPVIFDYSLPSTDRGLLLHNEAKQLRYERVNGTIPTVSISPIQAETWCNVAITNDGTSFDVYVNGSIQYTTPATIDSSIAPMYIGRLSSTDNESYLFNGLMSDFRIYDGALSSTDVASLYSNGPNPSLLKNIPRIASVSSTITPVSGAIAYRLTSQKTGFFESIVADSFTDLEQVIKQLTPETEYTIRLYSTENGVVYTLVEESVVTTLPNVGSSYDKIDFVGESGRFDLSTLDAESSTLLYEVMNDVFATGDAIDIKVFGKTKQSKFVNRGDVMDVSNTGVVMAPFSTTGGSGQAISMTLSDSTSVNVLYNETTEAVTIGSTVYEEGDSLVLDGRKVTIVDI